MDQGFVIVCGEIKAATLAIFEVLQQHIEKLLREGDFLAAPAQTRQLQNGIGQIGIVIEVGADMRLAIFSRCQQSAVAPQRMTDEIQRTCGRPFDILAAQRTGCAGHAANRQRVPAGQDFFVAARPDSRSAHAEQFAARRIEQRRGVVKRQAVLRGYVFHGLESMQMPVLALEVGFAVQSEARFEYLVLVGGQQRTQFCGLPDIELAFVAF